MHHNAKGVDQDGNLMVDIQINGEVPMFPANITLNLKVCHYSLLPCKNLYFLITFRSHRIISRTIFKLVRTPFMPSPIGSTQ